MTKIINVLNNGHKDGAKVGEVQINSFNVAPDTITADASPATIATSDLNLYDYWNVTQDDADTDEFDLPDGAAVGQVITLYCVDVFELRTETDTSKINNVASKGYKTALGDLLTCTKVSSTEWVVSSLTKLGAAVTITAGIS